MKENQINGHIHHVNGLEDMSNLKKRMKLDDLYYVNSKFTKVTLIKTV